MSSGTGRDHAPPVPGSFSDPHSPDGRDLAAAERDLLGEARDDAAGDRSLQADLRDLAAARRDELAEDVLAQDYSLGQLLDLYLLTRRHASAERTRATAERHAATEDRLMAARDRHDAADDREMSAGDRREASLDFLTGAYTRAAGFKELHRDVARARRDNESFTLAFIDVDGLKATNDRHGHAAGDRALTRVVQALRAHLRQHDLIIRFGGDEFLCAVASMDDAGVEARLALVRHSLGQADEQVHITVGLATLRPDESAEALVERADAAFYAIREGR